MSEDQLSVEEPIAEEPKKCWHCGSAQLVEETTRGQKYLVCFACGASTTSIGGPSNGSSNGVAKEKKKRKKRVEK